MQNEQVLKTATSQSPDWRIAVQDFVTASVQLMQPFTSGHITTILRVYRPDLQFSHYSIGEMVRDMFYNGEIEYSGDPAVQEPRTCIGLGRTPAGTTVFVVGPDSGECLSFPFELDIPAPGSGLTQMPKEHPIQAGTTVTPSLPSPADMKATVHQDLRLCVPRAALEGLLHATGRSFDPTKKVWVRFEGAPDYDQAIITLDETAGSADYGVQKTRGRILFPKAGPSAFQHGDIFAVDIVGDELVVEIGNPL